MNNFQANLIGLASKNSGSFVLFVSLGPAGGEDSKANDISLSSGIHSMRGLIYFFFSIRFVIIPQRALSFFTKLTKLCAFGVFLVHFVVQYNYFKITLFVTLFTFTTYKPAASFEFRVSNFEFRIPFSINCPTAL
jgi:hypothetical protein